MKNPWSRSSANLVSDFSARETVIAEIEKLRPRVLFDLGCGEGFISRRTAGYWCEHHGYDNSKDQINQAKKNAVKNSNFYLMDMNETIQLESSMTVRKGCQTNCCFMGIFSISYLKKNIAKQIIEKIWGIQTRGDSGLFTLPHPLVTSGYHPPNNFFSWDGVSYFDTDKFVFGHMAGIDGTSVRVGCFHKTFEDIFEIFKPVFESEICEFQEIGLTNELCPSQFSTLINQPLHIKIKWQK